MSFSSRALKSGKRTLMIGALALLPWTATACSTTVRTPERPERPVTAYLAHYAGHHNSLLLPTEDGLVEYSFGDWDWYATSSGTTWDAIKGMVLPTRGALGRRRIAAHYLAPGDAAYELGANRRFRGFTPLIVSADRVLTLSKELDRTYDLRRGTELYNELVDLSFVEFPRSYAAWNTCNHQLSGWLETLGCEVGGLRLGHFQVE